MDLSGMERRGGDAALAQALLNAARAVDFPQARVGVAATCVAAAMATCERGLPWRVVPPGRDAQFVSLRPLESLPMEPELRWPLELLGLYRCADLARLAAADVELRFGAEGLRAWRLARAEDTRWPFRPPSPDTASAEAELEAPVETTEPLRFLLRGLVTSVALQMAQRQRLPAALRLVLLLDGGDEEVLSVRPARPTAEERVLVDLCWRALEDRPVSGRVIGVRLEGEREGVARADQLDIFHPPTPDPAAIHEALLPLLARWGEGALSRSTPRGAHLPAEQVVWEAMGERGVQELARATLPVPSPDPQGARAELFLCLRRFTTPRAVRVERDTAGRPTIVWGAGLRGSPDRLPVRVQGPERLSGRWWDQGYAREYWLAETEDGRFWLLFRDAREERWYLEGWYD